MWIIGLQVSSYHGRVCKFNLKCGLHCIYSNCRPHSLLTHTLLRVAREYKWASLSKLRDLVTHVISYDFHHDEIYFFLLPLSHTRGISFISLIQFVPFAWPVHFFSLITHLSTADRMAKMIRLLIYPVSSHLPREQLYQWSYWIMSNQNVLHTHMNRGKKRDEINRIHLPMKHNFLVMRIQEEVEVFTLTSLPVDFVGKLEFVNVCLTARRKKMLPGYICFSFSSSLLCPYMSGCTFVYAIYKYIHHRLSCIWCTHNMAYILFFFLSLCLHDSRWSLWSPKRSEMIFSFTSSHHFTRT